MQYLQSEIRRALADVGADLGAKKPGAADVLAAIAMCESPGKPGYADADEAIDGTLTVFRLLPDPNPGLFLLRDRDWLASGLDASCSAALALSRMHGLKYWSSFRSKEYRSYLPEFFPPETVLTDNEIPYKLVRVLPHFSLLEHLKLCGWVAPSLSDGLSVMRLNGLSYGSWPVHSYLKVPNQRGW